MRRIGRERSRHLKGRAHVQRPHIDAVLARFEGTTQSRGARLVLHARCGQPRELHRVALVVLMDANRLGAGGAIYEEAPRLAIAVQLPRWLGSSSCSGRRTASIEHAPGLLPVLRDALSTSRLRGSSKQFACRSRSVCVRPLARQPVPGCDRRRWGSDILVSFGHRRVAYETLGEDRMAARMIIVAAEPNSILTRS